MEMLLFKTKFPYRAVVIACILFFLTFIPAVNYMIQNGMAGPIQFLIVYFFIVIILYFLFLRKITVIRFRSQSVEIKRSFRFFNATREIEYLVIQKVVFKHQDVGGALLVFHLLNTEKMRVRYHVAGGMRELRKISNLLRNKDIPLIIKRHGSGKSL